MQSSALEQLRPDTDWLEGSLAGKILGIPLNNKLNSCVALWQRYGNCVLGYIKSVEGIQHPSLFDVCEIVFRVQAHISTPQYKTDIDILEQGWWKATNMKKGLEYMTHEERPRETVCSALRRGSLMGISLYLLLPSMRAQ